MANFIKLKLILFAFIVVQSVTVKKILKTPQ